MNHTNGYNHHSTNHTNAPARPINPVVQEIGQMDWGSERGMWTPHAWYQSPLLRHQNGKPNLNAILLLSDVLYWYRPTVEREEHSGKTAPLRQKFSGHRLQKSYKQWGESFGLSKDQVQLAVHFLRDAGLLLVEVRERVEMGNGVVLGNVVYIEPIIEAIREVTFTFSEGEQ